jgi:membrane protein implicated in regulation of membrane protease activity
VDDVRPSAVSGHRIGDVDPWVIWVVAAVLLVVIEVTTLDLTFLMLASGAAAGAAAAGFGLPVWGQLAVAVPVALAMVVAVRPIALRHMRQPLETRTGVAALVGSQAVVLERVDAETGRVKLAGEVWSARAFDPEAVHEPGATVDVAEIQGAIALVL